MISIKIKKISASCSIMALLLAIPFPTRVLAEQKQAAPSAEQVPGGGLWGAIMGMSTQITQQMQAQRQQQQQMLQMQKMMSSLAPKNIPAKYFPQCQIPQTIPNTPVGVCEAPAGQMDHGTFNLMNNMAELGSNYVRYYDQMLTPAQNSSAPTGLRCLEDAKTSVISSMYDRQNALQVLIDKINKETQLFRDENAKFLQKMDDLNAELHGEGGTQTNESKTMSFADEFSSECRAIIGSNNLSPAKARQRGLTGLVEVLRPEQEKASDFRSNEANLEKSFNKAKSKLAEDLTSKGPADILAELQNQTGRYQGFEGDQFGAIQATIARKLRSMDSKKDRIEAELNELIGSPGSPFRIPEVNSTFVEDFDRFIQGADDFYRKKYVGDCVIGRDKGFALDMDQVLSGLEQRSTNSTGTAHITYRKALENILAQDSYIEDKMAEIRQLDQRFDGEITITFRDDNANRKTATPYELLQETVARCEQAYFQDETYSTNGPQVAGAGSQNRAVERAKNLMNDFKQEVQDFQTGLIAEVENKFKNCEGQEVTAQSCKEEDIFSPLSPSFCMKSASKCSRRIQSCDQRAKQLVEERKAEIKVAAAQFNQNVQQLVTRQEQILNDVRNQVLADSEFLKSYFPGADYKYPEDLFVKMPELKIKNGEMIYGGGKIDFKDLSKNVGKLKAELATQSDKIDGVLSKYIDNQKKQIEKNKGTWERIAQECRSSAKQMAQAKAQQEAEQMKQQQEGNAELGTFCRKFNSLASTENPAAGCSGPFSPETLYEDSVKISARLDNKVSGALGDYMALCNQTQNESKHGSEGQDSDRMTLAEACEEGIYSLENEVISNAIDSIPSDLESYRGEIEDYLLGNIDTDELPQDVRDHTSFARALGNKRTSLKLNKNDAESELRAILKREEISDDLSEDIVERFSDQVKDGQDRYCATQIFKSAKAAAQETATGDSFSDFDNKFSEKLEDKDDSYQSSTRAIASTNNAKFDQSWNDIGQGVGENCEATANTSRGWPGEMMGPDMGVSDDVMKNLGITR